MSEVRNAAFQMEHNKAPGPDGFPAEFYQVFWEVIKDDLMALFADFHNEDLNLFSLNFGIIMLIPKVREATKIQQYTLLENGAWELVGNGLRHRFSNRFPPTETNGLALGHRVFNSVP